MAPVTTDAKPKTADGGDMDRFHLVEAVIDQLPQLGPAPPISIRRSRRS